jgi:hypothetical protein
MSARVAMAVATAVAMAAATVVETAVAMAAAMVVETAVAMAAAMVAVPVLAELELVVPEAAVPELVLELVVPEAAVLELAVLEAAVRVPVPEEAVAEAAVLEAAVPELVLAVLEAAVPGAAVPEAALELVVPEAAVPELGVLEVAVLVVPVGEARVRPGLVVVLRAVPEVAQLPGLAEPVRVAAQAEPLRRARAMARRVPVSVETAVETAPLARRVRSVPSPARRAWASPRAVAHPMGRRRMELARGRTAHRALGVGHGVTSWRPLLSRRNRAPTSCVPSTSGATSSRAPQTA